MIIDKSRRSFLTGLSASGAASLFGSHVAGAQEVELETTAVRFAGSAGVKPLLTGSVTAEELIHATLYAMPNCDCCIPHAKYLRANGFDVEVIEPQDLAPIRRAQSVPSVMEGCHTILVEGYVVEGHVSADIIKRLLSERPAGVRGISIPGMPTGVPGMPGPRDYPIDVYAFGTGKPRVFAKQH